MQNDSSKFKNNKLLGQNFLICENIVDDIITASELKEGDVVLEVGPGKGVLTEALLKKAGRVIAIEKDDRLVAFLQHKFHKEIETGKLILISRDILKLLITDYQLLITNKYKIIANIPYYITSHFLRKFLESDFQPSMMVLMIQKEVAERITGERKVGNVLFSRTDNEGNSSKKNIPNLSSNLPPLKNSILSISVKAYGRPEIIKNVLAECFSPKPKVDSAVLKISDISKNFFDKAMCVKLGVEQCEKEFFALVKQGFASKRKVLKNNLKTKSLPNKFSGRRAEELSLGDWKELFFNFNETGVVADNGTGS